jgi:hypothetical protein
MKTGPVKALVAEVLATIPPPYSEHVIDDVFFAIESTPEWFREYESMCSTLGKTVLNNWTGYWVATALGKQGEHQVPRRKSKLITSYSLLDTDAKTVMRKPKENDAREMMFAYYQAHKSELPKDIAKYRGAIIELLMEGVSPAEAFRGVQEAQ